jgi:hypothetical protein
MCTNYNNSAVISDNYGMLQGLILLFKFSMGMGKDFLDICGYFGIAPSKMFASPGE